ncbi:MAG TPA: hypothetical protein DEA44_05830 [Firmicutes bacterium]|nr:hypothetical protein [Bacillota bacterium]HWR56649.1 hypothetical protein [Negativicutes bacterium]
MNTYLYLSTIFIIMVSGIGFFAFSIPYEFVDYRRVAVYLLVGTGLGFINSLVCILLRRRTY